ncbi:hypothetical protein [Xylocopilactobacillus apicola]|uniref:Lipoprotein n=1 Tax=Xylocopilactobacillus apicola TaxID=2932184 RepID=A0AAU9D314_9LACO|nr:hypothetical protein [Xylocopilactobacillus apicola]BDR59196.1 hypothetical protein XA3_16370 [Xylocopilactobacillus apicola]
MINKQSIKIGIALIFSGLLMGCESRSSSSDKDVKSQSAKIAQVDKSVQEKIKNATYSYTETKDSYNGYPIDNLKTAVGDFTIHSPELSWAPNPKTPEDHDKDLVGFKFLFEYHNTTKEAQNGITALQSIMKVKEMVRYEVKTTGNQMKMHLVTTPYVGMDRTYHDEELARIANNKVTTEPGATTNYLVSFVTKEAPKSRKIKGKRQNQAIYKFFADPKSKVELKTVKRQISWRFD